LKENQNKKNSLFHTSFHIDDEEKDNRTQSSDAGRYWWCDTISSSSKITQRKNWRFCGISPLTWDAIPIPRIKDEPEIFLVS